MVLRLYPPNLADNTDARIVAHRKARVHGGEISPDNHISIVVFEALEPRLLLDGASYLVNSLADVVADDGVVTLREAIEAANTNTAVTPDVLPGSAIDVDTITFDQAALQIEAGVGNPLTITLNGTQLEITDDLDIHGLGAGVLTIDANGRSRVFHVAGSGTEVELGDLTITGGFTTGNGGGVYNSHGTLTVTNSTISGNSAADDGGGIYNDVRLTVTNSTISGNSAADDGGGIYNYGTLTVTNSTVSGNSADDDGGGIYNDYSTLTVTNSTVSGNSAEDDGGGIYNNRSTLTVTNSTISGNSTGRFGGGIYDNFGTLTVANSILCLNLGGDIHGSYDGSNSLIGTDPGFVREPSYGADGEWGTADDDLGDLHLTDKSLAIDAGDNALAIDADGNPLTTDLAGNPRRFADGTVDIGAYEYQGPPASGKETPSLVVSAADDEFDRFDGDITLREAIYYSESGIGDGTVTFDGSLDGETITLSGWELLINHSIVIDASALSSLTVDADNNSRVFYIADDVTLSGLTITGGSAYEGGGVYNSGTLTLSGVTVTQNQASWYGGGIRNYGGVLRVNDSTVSGNSASHGGGVASAYGRVIVTESTVTGNHCTGEGGGLNVGGGEMTVSDSFITANTATDDARDWGKGGGVFSYNSQVMLERTEIVGSVIQGNEVVEGVGGGGISNGGTMIVTDCIIRENKKRRSPDYAYGGGGGICFQGGSAVIIQTEIWGNEALGEWACGGGIYLEGDAQAELRNVDVHNNTAEGYGGGGFISWRDNSLLIRDSYIHDNQAGYGGGGIYNTDGYLEVLDSTISTNQSGSGGGLYCDEDSTTYVVNSTLSGNQARGGGGGVRNYGDLTLTHATVVDNQAPGAWSDGGGVSNAADGALTMNNSIVALNSATNDGPDVYGVINTASHNLIGYSDGSNGVSNGVDGNLVGPEGNVSPLGIGGLDDNGGATPTHVLLPGSPAIDVGEDSLAVDPQGVELIYDQRGQGFNRRTGDAVDMGAAEYGGEWGAITGVLWHDVDGDGLVGADEQPLSDRQVYLDLNGNRTLDAGESATTTTTDGSYGFGSLSAGTYDVAETLPTDWQQTHPAQGDGTYSIEVHAGQTVGGVDFGSRWTPGTLQGHKWHDIDYDAQWDADEPGLGGWRIYLDINGNRQFDAGEPSVVTAADGSYAIDVTPGDYSVREELVSGWVQKFPEYPDQRHWVSVSPGDVVAGLDFGNWGWPGEIHGRLWQDANQNAQRDDGELDLEDWTVFLDKNGNGYLDGDEPSHVTDWDGLYSFTDVPPGTHAVTVERPAGWIQTFPTGPAGAHVVVMTPETEFTDIDFGLSPLPGEISGTMWEDVGWDGVIDPTDPPLTEWIMYLDLDEDRELDPGEPSTVTDENGAYCFTDVEMGEYSIWYDSAFGHFSPTYPSPLQNVIVGAGESVENLDLACYIWPSGVYGKVWQDVDQDAVRDVDELGLGGWTVYLDANGNELLDSGEQRTVTNEDGVYYLTDISEGTYVVRQVLPENWRLTDTATDSYEVTITRGTRISDVDFANYKLWQNYTVNSLLDVVADDGVITLREAIDAASSNDVVGDAPAGAIGVSPEWH